MVYSLNSGHCPGSSQPTGLVIWAILTSDVLLFTRPKNSLMIFSLFPAAFIIDGDLMNCAIEI